MENEIKEQQEEKTVKAIKPMYYYAGLGLLAAVLIILVAVIAITSYRAEKKFASDKFTLGVAKMIGLPAGFVEGKRVSYVEFAQDLQAVEASYKNAPVDQVVQKPTEEEMRKNVWDMLARNAVISKEASKNNIVVSDKDVEDEYANLVKTVGTEADAEQLIKDNYGWTKDQFKERVLRPFVLSQKLSLTDAVVEKLSKEPEQKAQEVLKQVQEGKKSFEDLAKEFSEDSTKENGGDLGWFGKGMMVKEFEDAVASLEPGKVSGLVKTQFGYHIIKLEEKRQDAKKETEWKARHILIKTGDFGQYVTELVGKAKVWKWINF
ncbi:MAG: peptidylprolyl isomerase [Candidatus Magasanikbacteria bacterium]|nr:peptidylprolyl isomerase [Candidatus Magasanikbacteria bacterium]